MPSLYPTLLGPSWSSLALPVQRLHEGAPLARGVFAVRRGASLAARLLAALLRMPTAAPATPIDLRVERRGPVERWHRRFGGLGLLTTQWADGAFLVEGMGLVQCWFRLRADAGALVFEQVRATLGWGRFTLRLPRALAPLVEGRAEPVGSRVRVDVRIHVPLLGLLVAYEGEVTPEEVR